MVVPEGYEEVDVEIKTDKGERMGQRFCFSIPYNQAPYDAFAKDRLVAHCPEDEDVIDIFRANRYTKDEINEAFDSFFAMMGSGEQDFDLPKPVKFKMTYYKYKGSDKKIDSGETYWLGKNLGRPQPPWRA